MCSNMLASRNTDFDDKDARVAFAPRGAPVNKKLCLGFTREIGCELQRAQGGESVLAGETYMGADGRINAEFYPVTDRMTSAGHLAQHR